MKLILTVLLAASSLIASSDFEKNIEYKCINTYSIQQDKKIEANKQDAENKPLIITIEHDKIYTQEKAVFNFLMQRGEMSSYSNSDFMLLLTKDLKLGLVPKKAKGQLQYYFDCKKS